MKALVEDAERRKEAQEKLVKMTNDKLTIERNQPFINQKSEKVMFERFDKDFERACQQLNFTDDDFKHGISCGQMSHLFLSLGFVKPNGLEQEQIMLANIWKCAGGDAEGQNKIKIHNCKVIMCCIQNFHIDWIIDPLRENEPVLPNQLGRFDDDTIYFTPDEISHITKKYVLLYKNRQDKLQQNQKSNHMKKAEQKGLLGQKYDYNPGVSKKNKDLAMKRLKEKEPEKAYMSIADRLVAQQNDSQFKKEQMKKDKEIKEIQQTFKPFVRSSSKKMAFSRKLTYTEGQSQPGASTARDRSKDIWENQYQMAKKYNKNLKKDLDQDEVEMRKDPKEYSFQPNSARRMESPRGMVKSTNLNSYRSTSSRKSSRKPSLDQGRKRLATIPTAPFNHLLGATDETEQNFQISVVIGGIQKQI